MNSLHGESCPLAITFISMAVWKSAFLSEYAANFEWRKIIFRTKHLPAEVILTSQKQKVSAKKGFTGPFKLFKSKGNCLDQLTNLLCNINNFLTLQRAAYSGKRLFLREFFARSFIFKSVVLECTNIMCFTKTPSQLIHTVS